MDALLGGGWLSVLKKEWDGFPCMVWMQFKSVGCACVNLQYVLYQTLFTYETFRFST